MVRLVGVEPTRLSALGFESSTSSIPPQAHNMDALAGADPATFAFRAQCSTVELEGDVLVDCTPVYQRCQAKRVVGSTRIERVPPVFQAGVRTSYTKNQ